MGAALVPLVLIAVVLAVAVVAVQAMTRRHEARADLLAEPDVDTLTWHVPEGQDPVPALTALRTQGYTTTTDADLVVVGRADGSAPDRERVRAVIAHADLNLEGDAGRRTVRFADE